MKYKSVRNRMDMKHEKILPIFPTIPSPYDAGGEGGGG
jgi:hypothetical protein